MSQSGRHFLVTARRSWRKFEAMVKLGVASGRMKDFYNLQVLSSRLPFDGKTSARRFEKHS
jgi:hypothetical protein